MVGAEIIGEVELAGCALLHAHGGVVELERRADFEGPAHHEALAVVERDGGEIEPERGVARQGPGGVARQHVDLAGLQRGETILRRQRHELDFGRIVENRRRDGAAEIDVEAGPIALRIGQAETRQRTVSAADQLAAFLDRRKRIRAGCLHAESKRHCQSHCRREAFHKQTFQDVWLAQAPFTGSTRLPCRAASQDDRAARSRVDAGSRYRSNGTISAT